MIGRIRQLVKASVPTKSLFWSAARRIEDGQPGRDILASVVALVLVMTVASGAMANQRAETGEPARSVAQQSGASAGLLAIVGASESNLYDAPGGNIIGVLTPGTVLTAVGRTADSQWIVVSSNSSSTIADAGWIEAVQVVMFGVDQLPIMLDGTTSGPNTVSTPIALPTPSSTPTATQTPTATPSPTVTPTLPPTPTATPTSTGSGSIAGVNSPSGQRDVAGVVAVVRGGGAVLLTEPEGEIVRSLATGTALTALARTPDSHWLYVRTSDDQRGWVDADDVVAFDLVDLQVIGPDERVAPSVGGDPQSVDVAEDGSTPGDAQSADEALIDDGAGVRAVAEPDFDEGTIRATVTLTDARLNVRTGPGTAYAIVGKVLPEDQYAAIGRSESGDWILILTPSLDSDSGWVAAQFVRLSEPASTLPVVTSDSQPSEPVKPAAAPTGSPAVPATASSSSLSADVAESTLTGRMVLQSKQGGALYVYEPQSGATYELTTGFDPAISPDGQTVAFTRIGGDLGLYLIDIDGSNQRRIYAAEELRGPTWNPDGAWIAFTRAAGSYQCRELGFGICLPDNPFLTSFPLVNKPERGLSRVDTNGEQFRDLPALTSVGAPDWAPGGIVYQSNTSLEITQDQPDATTNALLTAPYYQSPVWQPGGDRIVFQSREGSHWEIFTVNSDGSGLAALTRPVTALVDQLPSNVAPAWSPDGQMIAYLSNRTVDNSAGAWRLWIMNADGSGQRPLSVNVEFDYTYTGEPVVSWGP